MPYHNCPDSKVCGANMGPIWGRQGPGGPHVGPMNLAIWVVIQISCLNLNKKLRVVKMPTLSSQVVMTISAATSNNKVGIMTTFNFHWPNVLYGLLKFLHTTKVKQSSALPTTYVVKSPYLQIPHIKGLWFRKCSHETQSSCTLKSQIGGVTSINIYLLTPLLILSSWPCLDLSKNRLSPHPKSSFK